MSRTVYGALLIKTFSEKIAVPIYGKRCLVLVIINLIPPTLFLTSSIMALTNNNFGIDLYAILLYRH